MAVTSYKQITSRIWFTDFFWRGRKEKYSKLIPRSCNGALTSSRQGEERLKASDRKKITYHKKLFKKLLTNLPAESRNDDKWSNEGLHGKGVQVAAPVRLSLRSDDCNNHDTRNTAVQNHLRFTVWGLLIECNSHFAFYCPTLHSRSLKIPLVHNSQAKWIAHVHFISQQLRMYTWQMSWKSTGQNDVFLKISTTQKQLRLFQKLGVTTSQKHSLTYLTTTPSAGDITQRRWQKNENWWNTDKRKTCPSYTLFTTNPRRICLEFNPGMKGERQAIKCLRHFIVKTI